MMDQESGQPHGVFSESTLIWTLLEEIATTQSYLEVVLRNQAHIRAKLEARNSDEVLDEMEAEQKSVFRFLWPKVIESMSSKERESGRPGLGDDDQEGAEGG